MNETVIGGTPPAPIPHGLGQAPQKTPSLTHQQLATLLVLEGQMQQLQIGANQLGGFLGLKDEADVLISARDHIEKAKLKFQKGWERGESRIIDVKPRLIQP